MLPACGQKKLKPWTKGGFDTHKYRNVFAEMGYPKKEIDAKLESIFQEVFHGPNKVYFEVGDDMAYMSDVKNYDGLLRLFAFMHLSGHYRVIEPK